MRIGDYLRRPIDTFNLGVNSTNEMTRPTARDIEAIQQEIKDCLEALQMGKKFGVFLENEYESKKIAYKQCLEIIDKYTK